MESGMKADKLRKIIKQYAQQDVMVAFSGGVDSALLLKLAHMAAEENGRQAYAVTVHTRLHPAGEMEQAEKLCREIGAKHMAVSIDELEEAGILDNPVERCYLCKKSLFAKIKELAASFQVTTVIEGTNQDDLRAYRPGIRALRELGIASPLAEAGMRKEEVRRLAAEYGLPVASKPSLPCLATRFPYGTRLTYEKMKKADEGEVFLKSFGLHNVRLRVHGDIARLEVDEEAFSKILLYKKEIIDKLKGLGYLYVVLDLEGFRSGSMDVGLEAENY